MRCKDVLSAPQYGSSLEKGSLHRASWPGIMYRHQCTACWVFASISSTTLNIIVEWFPMYMRRALRPLGAYHELPLCVVPAPGPGQPAEDAHGNSSSGGWAVNTDMGFVSAPITASAAEVHEYVEVQPHHQSFA